MADNKDAAAHPWHDLEIGPGAPSVFNWEKWSMHQGKASIQNAINTTRILINPEIPGVELFRNRLRTLEIFSPHPRQ
ncbi:inorganic diphosphatase [Trifolium repens]|nr:inorganic diphosphatase [Trifolium repens]